METRLSEHQTPLSFLGSRMRTEDESPDPFPYERVGHSFKPRLFFPSGFCCPAFGENSSPKLQERKTLNGEPGFHARSKDGNGIEFLFCFFGKRL